MILTRSASSWKDRLFRNILDSLSKDVWMMMPHEPKLLRMLLA